MPARKPWWGDAIKSDFAKYYSTAEKAQNDDGVDDAPGGSKGSFIWGDRVRVI